MIPKNSFWMSLDHRIGGRQKSNLLKILLKRNHPLDRLSNQMSEGFRI
ncbi:hypothetical protein KSF78_0003949 [Schistosoma japonicum]|nr:hypothetical protein KSF78_0003949 [Schistosoma japonicum]